MKSILGFLIVSTVLVSHQKVCGKTCDPKKAFELGIDAVCKNELSEEVSCHEASFNISEITIKCKNGYFNQYYEIQQTLECDGKSWKGTPMKCFPECNQNIEEFDFSLQNELKLPTSYVDIIAYINGTLYKYRGVILSERHILTNINDYVNKDNFKHFVVRIYYEESKYTSLRIDALYNFKPSPIIQLRQDNFIVFNDRIKPVCPYLPFLWKLGYDKEIKEVFRKVNYLPNYDNGNCQVPKINKETNIEMNCYNTFEDGLSQTNVFSTECSKPAPLITLDCPIGFKRITKREDGILDSCIYNQWSLGQNIQSCESNCGKIIHDDKNTHQDISLENSPWHVEILYDYMERVCSGVIIHSTKVLTVASCFYDRIKLKLENPRKYLIAIRNTFEHSRNGKILKFHKDFSPETLENNIAIVTVDLPFEYFGMACFDWSDRSNEINENINGVISYWGKNNTKEILKTLNFKITSSEKCNSSLTREKFCAETDADSLSTFRNRTKQEEVKMGSGFVIEKQIDSEKRYFLYGILNQDYTNGSTVEILYVNDLKGFIQESLKEERTIAAKLLWNQYLSNKNEHLRPEPSKILMD